jgi:putative transposase
MVSLRQRLRSSQRYRSRRDPQLELRTRLKELAAARARYGYRPGKTTENGLIETFNARLRAECLNASWFLSMIDARDRIEEWRCAYNEDRPYSALGNLTPKAFASQAQPGVKPRKMVPGVTTPPLFGPRKSLKADREAAAAMSAFAGKAKKWTSRRSAIQ